MKAVVFFLFSPLFALFLAGCTPAVNNTKSESDQANLKKPDPVRLSDEAILLTHLLETHQSRHRYIDSVGQSHFDKMSAYKELEQIYSKLIHSKDANGQMSDESLKTILLFSFYAKSHQNAAISEHLADDLIPIYQADTTRFVKALANLPFLIEANCDRLAAGLQKSSEPSKAKQQFLEANHDILLHSLKPYNTMQCLEQFK